ncbi:MAG: adenylosuccinate lyase [Cryomorphaceae bacterium]|nr:MAG: adenylosuccinate lyase [Cryomorphaceae bacterium]
MQLDTLKAISPVDGRYRKATEELAGYFSESALIRYRVMVEVEYFIALCKIPLPQLQFFDHKHFEELRNLYLDFSLSDAQHIKETETITNHDVKAVEYFIKTKLDEMSLSQFKEFVHFGLTSQDINNTAVPASIKDAMYEVVLPLLEKLNNKLKELALLWSEIPMLARTHGQPASPTILGKEIKVFQERLTQQLEQLQLVPFAAKFGGATGNFNAHHVAYPEIEWMDFANHFVNDTLNLKRSQTTTQIEHYDHLAALCDNLKRINTIVLDLNRDMWTYISMDYFKQQIREGEVGSSAMPHKVNPIDFENSEGNLGVANALLEHLAAKLPVSRLQRDLTDSTVLRNIGMPMAHMLIAYKATLKGLNKLLINREAIDTDLENNWAVVAEAIQTVLRREAYEAPYEALKSLTRTHGKINKEAITAFVDSLEIDPDLKEELKAITPQNYTGINQL